MRSAKHHRPKRPRRIWCATNWWLRQQLELRDALRALTNARAGAIGPSVTPTDDDDIATVRVNVGVNTVGCVETTILRDQIIHREVDARQLSSRNWQIAGRFRTRGDANCVEA